MTAVLVPGFAIPEVPIGTVFDYLGAVAPEKYLLLDGSAVSRTTYSALFSLLGTTWGAGDGSTTFNLPDTRGKVSVGLGTGAGLTPRSLGDAGGEESHVLVTAELASHTHTSASHSHAIPQWQGAPAGAINTNIWSNNAGGASAPFNTDPTTPGPTGSVGSNTAHNNMQPFNVFARIVRAL